MSLETKDLEIIETMMRKVGEDIVVSSQRSLERVEERIDCAETRLYGRISDIEDQIADKDQISRRALEIIREELHGLNQQEY